MRHPSFGKPHRYLPVNNYRICSNRPTETILPKRSTVIGTQVFAIFSPVKALSSLFFFVNSYFGAIGNATVNGTQ